MRSTLGIAVLASAFLSGACAARVATAPPPRGTPTYDSFGHELVPVSPGVQVIADYDESIFYADQFYWRFDGGQWYRSAASTGGWVPTTAPVAVLRIRQPQAYVHYRPAGWQKHQGRARSARRVEPPKSMYQSPPRRLAPLPPPEGYPNGRH